MGVYLTSTRADPSMAHPMPAPSRSRRFLLPIAAVLVLALLTPSRGFDGVARRASPPEASQDSVFAEILAKGYRFERSGWTYVHLEGSPHDMGIQHGYLLAPEIADTYGALRLEMTHSTRRNWDFFRRAAREMLWPKIDPEYQQELQGIADGLADRKVKLDLWDVVAMNAFAELPDYYIPWLDQQTRTAVPPSLPGPGHCSAFVAVGSWTKDQQIVMAHNNWTTYVEGARWRILYDLVPSNGYRIFMDGIPGVITSDDDFGVNSNGLMVTETTIARFHGWDPGGKPEFVRARKAMQYAGSIDDYVRIMQDGNNGGYANDWLLGDRKTGEIARFEQGLKHAKLWRTTDGYFAGSNFPSDADVTRDETTFDSDNPAYSPNARHIRWDQLINQNKGKIDVPLAQVFLADHFDTFTKKEGPNIRTLCGHGDLTGDGSDLRPYEPYGAVQGKAMDSSMAKEMAFVAHAGHPCGIDFDAAKFLSAHGEYSWEASVLRDMSSGPWTSFQAGEHEPSPIP